MKTTFLISITALVFLYSCNIKSRNLSEGEIQEITKEHNDSIIGIVENANLERTSIYVPPLYNEKYFDPAAISKYFELAKETKGEMKLIVNSKLVVNEIIEVLKSHGSDNADILFLIDKTGSMQDDIENVQKGFGQILKALEKYKNIRLAIAFYGDENVDGAEWFNYKTFDGDFSSAEFFVNSIKVSHGGDYPESVYEAFFKTVENEFWQSEKRIVLLIGDAPPIEKPAGNYTMSDVIDNAKENGIVMNFYPIIISPVIDDKNISAAESENYESAELISELYPNPASEKINIEFTVQNEYRIEIFNTSGEIVLDTKINDKQWMGDVSFLEIGLYLIRVSDNNRHFSSAKLIIQR